MKISKDRVVSLVDSQAKRQVLKQLIQGGVLTERRIAKYVGLAHVSVSDILDEFERFRLARSQRVGRANLWTLNRESYAFKAVEPLLMAYNRILSLKEALKEAIRNGLPKGTVQEAILFGSLTNDLEEDDSDIDVCLITGSGKQSRQVLTKAIDKLGVKCHQLFGKKLSPYFVSVRDWPGKQKTVLGKQILKGEKIYP